MVWHTGMVSELSDLKPIKDQTQTPKSKKELTMGAGEANIYALVFLIPLILILGFPYYYRWPEQFTIEKIKNYLEARELLTIANIGIGIAILVAGVIVHELLHGLAWGMFAKGGWKSIKFGIIWKYVTPYCHSSEPLSVKEYRIGTFLPAVILGFIPSIIAIFVGSLGLMAFGFFFSFAAGGDFLILWLLRNEKASALVQDHPDKVGCFIIRQEY